MARRAGHPPLPNFIEPMLASLSPPFESTEHGYELKWDGFRALCFIDADGVRLVGRRTTDFTTRFPELIAPLDKLPRGVVLDGEIVRLTDGRPDFAALLSRERSWSGSAAPRRSAKGHAPVTFVAFDVLYEKGVSIMTAPLIERRTRLDAVVAKHVGARLAVSEMSTGNGLALFAEVSKLGLEGVVAKRLDGRYEPGQRSGSWLKFKRRHSIVCLILGYELSRSGGIKSLMLAAVVGGELRFVGQVGSGLDDTLNSRLLARFRGQSAPSPVVPANIARGQAKGRWIRPTLLCRVSFAEWTDAGRLRQPVFESILDADVESMSKMMMPVTKSMYEAGRPTPDPDA